MRPGEKENKRTVLRLIRGGRHFELSFKSVRIIAGPENTPPFPVDAVAAEEDTYLVLSADRAVREPKEHPVRLLTQAIETPPAELGSVVVKGRRPLRLLAIVHDLNQEPSWREEWIARALEGIFREGEGRKLQSMALPMLGTKHGSFKEERFVALLRGALERIAPQHLKCLWLVTPLRIRRKIFEMLESEMQK